MMNYACVIFAVKEEMVINCHIQFWPLHNHTTGHHPKAGLKELSLIPAPVDKLKVCPAEDGRSAPLCA